MDVPVTVGYVISFQRFVNLKHVTHKTIFVVHVMRCGINNISYNIPFKMPIILKLFWKRHFKAYFEVYLVYQPILILLVCTDSFEES